MDEDGCDDEDEEDGEVVENVAEDEESDEEVESVDPSDGEDSEKDVSEDDEDKSQVDVESIVSGNESSSFPIIDHYDSDTDMMNAAYSGSFEEDKPPRPSASVASPPRGSPIERVFNVFSSLASSAVSNVLNRSNLNAGAPGSAMPRENLNEVFAGRGRRNRKKRSVFDPSDPSK